SVRTRRDLGFSGDNVERIFDNLAVETRARELLEAAKRVTGVAWNPVYFVPGLPGSFVSAMAPVRRHNVFDGVVIAAVPVSALSRVIEGESGGCSQQWAETSRFASCMFILNATDGVVAHYIIARGNFEPTLEHPLPQRMDLADPILKALWSARDEGGLVERHMQATGTWVRRIDVDGQTYFVLLRLVQGYSPQPWTVGIYFQATQITEPILQLRLALALGLLILAAAVAAALLLGLGLARPIRRLALAAEAVTAFDFSGSRR